jgi:RNA polymerase sigma-70 factor (ECF subfamily)
MGESTDQVIDAMLVLRCQSGDAAAFDLIAARWQSRLVRHAVRLLGDAEAAGEAVQEAWLAIVRGLQRLEDPARFGPWAYRIVRHKCSDRLRRVTRARARETGLDDSTELDSGEAADIRVASRDQRAVVARLRAALRVLPPEHRTLLTLFYFEQMPVADIAEAMDLPAGTVKSRLFHLRAKLRATMEEDNERQV